MLYALGVLRALRGLTKLNAYVTRKHHHQNCRRSHFY